MGGIAASAQMGEPRPRSCWRAPGGLAPALRDKQAASARGCRPPASAMGRLGAPVGGCQRCDRETAASAAQPGREPSAAARCWPARFPLRPFRAGRGNHGAALPERASQYVRAGRGEPDARPASLRAGHGGRRLAALPRRQPPADQVAPRQSWPGCPGRDYAPSASTGLAADSPIHWRASARMPGEPSQVRPQPAGRRVRPADRQLDLPKPKPQPARRRGHALTPSHRRRGRLPGARQLPRGACLPEEDALRRRARSLRQRRVPHRHRPAPHLGAGQLAPRRRPQRGAAR